VILGGSDGAPGCRESDGSQALSRRLSDTLRDR
jgi:hypothetical protein